LDNCIKLAESFVDFALNKHSKVIGHIYPKQKSVSVNYFLKKASSFLFSMFSRLKNDINKTKLNHQIDDLLSF
jgi:hypothetical protein